MKQLLKSKIFLGALILSAALVFQECKANKCDGCPALKKKVKKATKGSI